MVKKPTQLGHTAIELDLAVWQLPSPRLNTQGTAKALPVGFPPAIC